MDSVAVILLSFLKLLLLSMVPYIFASQGTMLSGRTGVFNVAQEGIMLVGASAGFLAAYQSGSILIGVAAALATGALFGLALAYFTTHLRMDQFVIGLALFFIARGLINPAPKAGDRGYAQPANHPHPTQSTDPPGFQDPVGWRYHLQPELDGVYGDPAQLRAGLFPVQDQLRALAARSG